MYPYIIHELHYDSLTEKHNALQWKIEERLFIFTLYDRQLGDNLFKGKQKALKCHRLKISQLALSSSPGRLQFIIQMLECLSLDCPTSWSKHLLFASERSQKKLLHSTEGLQKGKRLHNSSSPNTPLVSSGYREKPLAGACDVL